MAEGETLFSPRSLPGGPRSTCQAPSQARFELSVVGYLGEGAGSRPPEEPCTLSRMEGEGERGSPSLQSGPSWGTGTLWVPTLS